MRATIWMAALLPWVLVGCGGSSPTFKVAGNTLTVNDQGYFITDGRFDYCQGGGQGQLTLDFVDYNFICDPKNLPQKAPESPHTELRVVLVTGPSPDYLTHYPTQKGPFNVATADCTNTGAPAIAQFLHYPNGHDGVKPDSTMAASSGTVTITQFDPTKVKPLVGSFDLHFGGDELKTSFTIFACN